MKGMDLQKYKIGFIGFGHLAEIIFNRLIQTKLIEKSQCSFVRKNKQKEHSTAKRLGILPTTLKKISEKSEILIFCVPPQKIQEVLDDLKPLDLSGKFLISVLASVTMQTFEKSLGKTIQLMRVLPNAPSMIGEGITTFCFNEQISTDYKLVGMHLFTSLGQILEVKENQMNVVCAIGASGPAYVLKLISAIVSLGCEKGLDEQTALKIVGQMFHGASKLALEKKTIDPLIQAIASPKGTTESGLNVYDAMDLSTQFQKVFKQAIQRAEELG